MRRIAQRAHHLDSHCTHTRTKGRRIVTTPEMVNDAALLLRNAGFIREDGQRFDAGETAFFARQLEYIKAETYDVLYIEPKARQLLPKDGSIPSGAESFTWRAWDWAGMASIIADYATDLPRVDVMAAEVTQKIKGIGDSYSYSLQDLRAAMMSGTSLDIKRAAAARRAIENKIERLAALGSVPAGLPGFANNSNVSSTAATGAWSGLTPTQILADLNKLANQVSTQTLGTLTATDIVLPLAQYNYIAATPMSVNDNRSILAVFMQNTPYIKNVTWWSWLATAGASSGTRGIAYAKTPLVVELVIPQEFEQLPPVGKSLAFEIACHARYGGVSLHYPLGVYYMDGM